MLDSKYIESSPVSPVLLRRRPRGLLHSACSRMSGVGGICSCNEYVQNALTVQVARGQALWAVKCLYS